MVHVEDNAEKVKWNDVYVGRIFGDENEAYDAYNSQALP